MHWNFSVLNSIHDIDKSKLILLRQTSIYAIL